MKRYLPLLFLLACAFACGKENASRPAQEPEYAGSVAATGTVSISLGGPFSATRVASPADSIETRCRRWAFWVFDQDGESVVYGTGQAGESIRKTLLVGSYTLVAVANYPQSLVPSGIERLADISQRVSQLQDNAAGSMLMYGADTLNLQKDRTAARAIDVRRLVSKVGVKKVSVAFENPYLAAKTTVLEAIYLTNLYRTSRLGQDYPAGDLNPDTGAWYNVMGWRNAQQAVSGIDRLVGDFAIGATLTPETPYTTPHYFYAYPNPTPPETDSHNAEWCIRSSRLVLQVAVGDKTYYYQVQIPAMGRNRVYVADEIILRKLGSLDPEQDIPGALDVVYSAVGASWDQDFAVAENS